MLSGLGGYSKEYRVQRTNNSKCGSNAVVLLCFFYGKIVPLSGGRAACGGGGKVLFMRTVGTGPAWIFLDRRTEVHKEKKIDIPGRNMFFCLIIKQYSMLMYLGLAVSCRRIFPLSF